MAQPLRVPRRPCEREASRLVFGAGDVARGVGRGAEGRRSTIMVDSIIGAPPVGLWIARGEGQLSFAKSNTRLRPFAGWLETRSSPRRAIRSADFWRAGHLLQ